MCPDRTIAIRLMQALALALLFITFPAHARLIGVVFDDSGSMAKRFVTPLHALQLLVGSLKEGDRMLIVRMSSPDPGKEIVVPDSYAERQELLNRMGRAWNADGGTPLRSLTTAIGALAARAAADEEIKLVVLTDGEFNESPAVPRDYVQALKQGFGGKTLDVYFVAIAPDGSSQLLDQIERQRVRPELLTQFNGSETAGKIDLRSADSFLDQMADLIARVNGNDPGNEQAIRYGGNSVEFTPPFAVKELTVLSKGFVGAGAPKLTGQGFPVRSQQILSGSMRSADAISPRPLSSTVFHVTPWPQLEGGKNYQLSFDRPVDADQVRLMFKTSVTVDWELLDDRGTVLKPDAQGVIHAGLGEVLVTKAKLYENDPAQGRREIRLDQLPLSPDFTLQSSVAQAGSAKGSQTMRIDPAVNAALAQTAFQQKGRYILAVRARYPGFLDLRPKDINIEVHEDRPLRIGIAVQGGAACPACRADRTELTYTAATTPREALLIEPRPETKGFSRGKLKLSLGGILPPGVWFLMPDGSPWDGSSKDMELESTKPFPLRLVYDRRYQQTSPGDIELRFEAQSPWKGTATLPIKLVPVQASASLSPRGHTLDPSGATPFKLKLIDLPAGEGLYFSVEGIEGDLDPAHLQVVSDTLRAPVAVKAEKGNLFRVVPLAWHGCDCFTAAGIHQLSIQYDNPLTHQRAALQGAFELEPGNFWERCWQEILALLLILLALLKVICLIRTHRFPRRAKLLWIEGDDTLRFKRLHSGWSWLWPACRCEHAKVFGLNLRATSYGVELLPGKAGTMGHLIYNGVSLEQHFEGRRNQPMRLVWGESIEDRGGARLEYKLVER